MSWPEHVAFMWWMDLNLFYIMLLDIMRWIWTYDGYLFIIMWWMNLKQSDVFVMLVTLSRINLHV
jgi:hypothetical protein